MHLFDDKRNARMRFVWFKPAVTVYLSVRLDLVDGDTDRRVILHDGTYQSRQISIYGGATLGSPQGPKFGPSEKRISRKR